MEERKKDIHKVHHTIFISDKPTPKEKIKVNAPNQKDVKEKKEGEKKGFFSKLFGK